MLYQSGKSGGRGFPEIGDTNRLPDFRDRLINPNAGYRNAHLARITRNYWYILHRQWIRRDIGVYVDSNRGFVYRDITRKQNNHMPMPVTNYCSAAVEVELAAQTKRQWTFKTVPTNDAPDVEAAAKEAEEWLTAFLDAQKWPMLRDRFSWQTIAAGTGIFHTYLDENYNELSVIAPGTEVKCAACSQPYHSMEVEAPIVGAAQSKGAAFLPGTITQVPSEDATPMMALNACPKCGGALEPFDLDPSAKDDQDPFGRMLGMQVPKAIPKIELVSCDEFYPENQGIGVTPENMRRYGIRKVRSISLHASEHWPDRVDEIDPISPTMLFRHHPLLGEWNYLGDYNYVYDQGIYDDHYFEDTLVELPCAYSPKGRLVVLAGSLVLYDGDLMRETQDGAGNTMQIPRSKAHVARYKERPGEFWGESIVDVIVSPQNRLNAGDSIDHDSMVRLGAPNILVPAGMNLTGPEWNPGYGTAKIMRYEADPEHMDAVPVLFGGQYFHDQWSANRKALIEDMKALVGPQDVEIGEAPRNISTTSGLQILGEQAERRRAARERGIVNSCEGLAEHILQLIWGFAFDDDTYEYWSKSVEGSWGKKQLQRLKIKGQTRVKIEKQAYVDGSLFLKESVREAMADQLLIPDTPMAREKMLRARGLPTDINERESFQVTHARRQWSDFINEGKLPKIDPTLDDPAIHFGVLGAMSFRDETKKLEEEVNWEAVLDAIAGWEDILAQAEAVDAEARAIYGFGGDMASMEERYAQKVMEFQQQDALYQAGRPAMEKAAATAQPGEAPPMMPEAPMKPPPPSVLLPAALEKRVFGVWTQMLQQKAQEAQMQGGPALPPTMPQYDALSSPDAPREALAKQQSYMRYQSVVQAYRLYQQKAAQAQAAAMAPPPPDGKGGQPVGTQPGGGPEPEQPPAPPGQPIRMTL